MKAHRSSYLSSAQAIPAALAALLLATTACSGDDNAAASNDASPDTTAPGPDAGLEAGVDVTTGADVATNIDANGGRDATGTTEAGLDAGDGGGDASVVDAGPLHFAANVWNPIVSVHCTSCHAVLSDGGPGMGIVLGSLDMGDAAVAFANLVGDGGGVPAQGTAGGSSGVTCGSLGADAGLKRVVPNDGIHSLIYNKVASRLDGGPAVICGSGMPLVGNPLSPGDVTTIRTWIDQGALP
jgi:hypothetical protein